ncbi:Mitochondrial import inner membrane translocase subunit Tim13 family protein [Hibiscus syriacus]|uniref:Mitochondrial import inner membrane translocase subunit Tim13 family protein n=1 Tax=Hibiscus syriacus TaxID=106335 RepID=A0A6A3A4T3_HIBSY|nr:Mitochondrial import inner membrane translocase subunit Tim13 family protein [Hibiscus syriacus]
MTSKSQLDLSFHTVELKVRMCCIGCERAVKRGLYKLRGINSLEVDQKLEQVIIVGHVDRHKVLKRVRRSGKRAEFWPYSDVPLYFTSMGDYFRDTRNEFKESYNYYKSMHRGDDNVSNMFKYDNVNAICCLM